jgi:hypothetical protein
MLLSPRLASPRLASPRLASPRPAPPRDATLASRIGARRLLLSGAALATAGTLSLATIPADGSYGVNVLPGLLLVGVGLGAGTIGTSQQLGGAIGLAIAAAIGAAAAFAPGAPAPQAERRRESPPAA